VKIDYHLRFACVLGGGHGVWQELAEGFGRLGIAMAGAEVAALVQILDTDGDGFVQLSGTTVLLARRARVALGTATQYTHINDSLRSLERFSRTGAGGDHGIDHNQNWLRFPYVSECSWSRYLHPPPS
jgi:hypothetical protein